MPPNWTWLFNYSTLSLKFQNYSLLCPWRNCEKLDKSFPGGSGGKESSCNVGDLGSIPGLGRSPGKGHGIPLQYSGLENLRGQRSLARYGPWSRKESDTTERLSTAYKFTE